MTDAAANKIKDRFNNLSAEFDNSRTSLSVYAGEMMQGAGEFSGSMTHGAGSFDISWRDCFQVCSTAAALIAGNTNQFHLDLDRLDEDARRTILL